MRGDSIRDLYAKSLAILGLALLGAVGAAVDYWPTDLATPRAVPLALSRVDPGPVFVRARASEPVDYATARASVVVRGQAPSAAIVPASFETVSVAEPEPELIPAPAPPPVELPALVPAAFTGIDSSPATEVELSAVELPRKFTMTTVAPAPAAARNQGLLPGIGSAIVGGTKEVGSAVADGLSTAAGAIGAGAKSFFKHLGGLFQTSEPRTPQRNIRTSSILN